MKILLAGASGFIGRHLVAALRHAGHEIVPVSRRHGRDLAALAEPADWMPLLDGVDAAVNAVGLIGETGRQTFDLLHARAPSALFRACAGRGVRRVVQISALGADGTAFSAYHLSKRAADDVLRSLPLAGTVLRPSLVHGPGGASTAAFLRQALLPVIPVVGDGRQVVQPVHVGDVVDAVAAALARPEDAPVETIDAAGPEVVTVEAWLQRLRAAAGRGPAPVLHLPLALVMAAVTLGRPFSPMLRPDNIRMLQAGSTADVAAFTRLLGRAPRAATPELLARVVRDTLEPCAP